jgi:GDP-4-dehydro-6-deoxy-D-mannose reductase
VKILVTGADGFVGSCLTPRLREAGYTIIAATRPDQEVPERWEGDRGIQAIRLEVTDPASVQAAVALAPDAVIHLAAVASGGDATRDPRSAWLVNAVGTALLATQLGRMVSEGRGDPLLLLVSTAEVYGRGPHTPRVEHDPTEPVSTYAASKLAAEVAALEVHRRTGLRVVISRAFAHTGGGQDGRFVVPALARRLLVAKHARAPVIKVGNLEPIREFMHVSDVVDAYCQLLVRGRPGEVYNVASGQGISLDDLLAQLMEVVGYRVIPEADPELIRPADIPYLVGDAAKLRSVTGWSPRIALGDALREVVDAQTH